MRTLQRLHRSQHEGGFTLAFTLLLSVVFTLIAMAVMTKILAGLRNANRSKSQQQLLDAATIGLNMALDEMNPGIERMNNTVWSSQFGATLSATMSQYVLGSSTKSSVREFSLLGNIRNWEPFADWSQWDPTQKNVLSYYTTPNAWNKGWCYLQDTTNYTDPQNFFDGYVNGVVNSNPQYPIFVGGTKTNGDYWYNQLYPAPPKTAALGNPIVAPASWPNAGQEYPNGPFYSPILYKVYKVRNNPLTRVAVYVRMSFQDYLDYTGNGGVDGYQNTYFKGRSVADSPSSGFDGTNFVSSNAVNFSIFAVSEPTWKSPGQVAIAGTRIHQALNVAVGGMEWTDIGAGPNDIVAQGSAIPPQYADWTQPLYPPSLDTPRGDNSLVAGTPITGQVYPASGDLSYSFANKPATDSVVFLYEQVDLAKSSSYPNGGTVVFLIEHVPQNAINSNDPSVGCYRRRLLYDWPSAYDNDPAHPGFYTQFEESGATPSSPFESGFDTIAWDPGSYSIDATADNSTDAWSSIGWFANRNFFNMAGGPNTPTVLSPGTQSFDQLYGEDHFATDSADETDTNDNFQGPGDNSYLNTPYQYRYPFTAWVNSDGTFTIGTTSAVVAQGGTPPADTIDVVNWPNNPLLAWDSGTQTMDLPMQPYMPWEGPTIADPNSGATVSYLVTTWPYMTTQAYHWIDAGGRLGLMYTAATQTIN